MGGTRRIVMFNNVSADGCFSSATGGLDWVVQDGEVDKAAMESGGGYDTVLFGRRTYEMFERFWPHALDDSPTAPNPHAAGQRSKEMKAMALFLNDVTKLVFSRSRKDVTWKNSRVLPGLDPGEIEALKRQPGKDMLMFGSGSIASQLTQAGLVDEYQFVVSPVLLGSGRTLLGEMPKPARVDLLEARKFASGKLLLRYGRPS